MSGVFIGTIPDYAQEGVEGVALSGVVINDSLVLMDRINRELAKGGTLFDAVLAGGRRRFRAIAFTSLTTNFPSLDPNNGQNDQTQITQIYAFNTIYFSTDGPNWRNRDGWTGFSDPCFQPTWHGVICDSPLEGSVAAAVELNLAANDLMGPLPSELRGLTSLRKF